MRTLIALTAALCVAGPCLAAAETYQLVWEMFDESRLTMVCTYQSRTGDYRVVEYAGRQFCPRVI